MLCIVGALFFFIGRSSSQEVLTPINIELGTGIQIESSTAVLNFELTPEQITLYWTFDYMNIYVCQITNDLKCGCEDIIDGSDFSDRLNGSCNITGTASAFLVLSFGPVLKSDSIFISMRSNRGNITGVGNVTLEVVEDCMETNATGVNTTYATPCGFECNKNFSCLDGFVGSATGYCQENATFTYENNCIEITCPIPPPIECGCGNCTFETCASVQFNNTIDIKCQEGCTGQPQARCSSSGTLQLDEGCTPIMCSTNKELACNEPCVSCAVIDGKNATYGETVYVLCNCGTTSGTGAATCCSDGNLSVVSVVCSEENNNRSSDDKHTDGELAGAIVGSIIGGVGIGVGLVFLVMHKRSCSCCGGKFSFQ